jgi:autotransporter-associated beta strand protein
VSLGNGSTNLLPTTNAPYTIQVWATDNQYQSWSRIFDFGSTAGGNSNLLWSWTEGTNPPGLVAPGPTSAGTYAFGTGTEYNVSLVVYPNGPGSIVQWYAMDTVGDLLGSGSLTTSWNISQLTQSNMWLGRSEYGDNDANATYQNVTIYNGALTQSQVVALNVAGPDASLPSLVPILTTAAAPALPSTTPVTVAPNATFDVNGGTQQIASLNDATPGNGGSVVNSNTSNVAVLTLSPTGSATFSGPISGDISLVLNGPGTQVLAGNNTYSAGTIVEAGTLVLNNSEAIPDGSSLIVGQGAASLFAPAIAGPSIAAASGGAEAVPEPGSLALLAAGAVGAWLALRRRACKGGRSTGI